MNVLPITINFVKKINGVLICHTESSLRMNHPELIKWVNEIPFVLFIKIEHDI